MWYVYLYFVIKRGCFVLVFIFNDVIKVFEYILSLEKRKVYGVN